MAAAIKGLYVTLRIEDRMLDVRQEALLMRRSGIVFERQYVKACMYTLPLRPPDMMAAAQV